MKWSTGAVVGFVGLMAMLGSVAPAAAQDKVPNIDLGFQFQRHMSDGDSLNFPLGLDVAAAYPVTGDVDVFGQFDWSRKSESATALGISADATENVSVFGGGVRWSSRKNMSVTPFVQGLFGVAHSSFSGGVTGLGSIDFSSTDPLIQVGAGVAGPLSSKLDWLGQFDYRRIFEEESGFNSIRVVLGVRLKLK